MIKINNPHIFNIEMQIIYMDGQKLPEIALSGSKILLI